LRIEATKATREVPKAKQRISANHRVAVPRESHAAVLREIAVIAFARKFENPIHQLDRVIPLEHSLRNLGPNQPQ
jgi:hypothetical protein